MNKVWKDSKVAEFSRQRIGVEHSAPAFVENELISTIPRVSSNSISLASDEASLNISLVYFFEDVPCAAVFTKSLCPSPAVIVSRDATANNRIRAIVVISKNAGLFSDEEFDDIEEILARFAKELGIYKEKICIACTGVIGVRLPKALILNAARDLVEGLGPNNLEKVAENILTTDKSIKVATIRVGDLWITAYAKGAGMIEPNMATMLAYVYTNYFSEDAILQDHLSEACDKTLNSLSVDSDTSTSDMVLLASIKSSTATIDSNLFQDCLKAVLLSLTQMIAQEAEGATKLIEVTVGTNVSSQSSKKLAKSIVNSPLVKCAINGADPNWGRIVMAIGKTDIPNLQNLNRGEISISIQEIDIYIKGRIITHDLNKLTRAIQNSEKVTITVEIGSMEYISTVWGCDLSAEYVIENSTYTS